MASNCEMTSLVKILYVAWRLRLLATFCLPVMIYCLCNNIHMYLKVARVAFYVNLTGPQAKRQKVAHIKHKAQINWGKSSSGIGKLLLSPLVEICFASVLALLGDRAKGRKSGRMCPGHISSWRREYEPDCCDCAGDMMVYNRFNTSMTRLKGARKWALRNSGSI